MSGLRLAESLRRFGYQDGITLIGDEPHLPYNRPPLSKAALHADVKHADVAFPLRPSVADVEWILGSAASSVDLQRRRVSIASAEKPLEYGALVIATGLRSRRIPIGNTWLPGRYGLRSVSDAARLGSALVPRARVVVVGAGFIGCEVAATARTLGCEVLVVSSGRVPMERPLGAQLGQELMRRHRERGVAFAMGSTVRAIEGDSYVSGILLDDGRTVGCDVLIEAIGSLPNTEWLAGNNIDLADGVLTDGTMRAKGQDGVPWGDVFAIGDIARFPNPRFGVDAARVEHWNIPTETAKRAAEILAAQVAAPASASGLSTSEPFAPIPSFWSDQYDTHLLGYGMLNLAQRIELLEGDIRGECVFGYFADEALVGVCGIGLRSTVMSYRERVGTVRK